MLPPIDNFSTGTYSSVFNGDGSIELAGADMKISDNFDLEKNLTHEISQTIQNTRLVIADLNLKPQLLHKIYSQFDPAVIKILDPTSIFKCHKIFQSPNLSPSDFFDIITPNLDEFVALLNLFGELEFGDQFDNEWSVDEFIYGNNGGVSGLENWGGLIF